MKNHIKHAKITRLDIGNFHKNEYSILGTPCGNIKKLAFDIISNLSTDYKIGYVDADHKSANENAHNSNCALEYGASLEYIDKINFHRFDTSQSLNEYDYRQHFSSQDLVLVNGNHFKAKKQIIVIDPKKPLEKKLEKLTNVALVLLIDDETTIPDYLKGIVENLPVLSIDETGSITQFIANQLTTNFAPLKGLVLAGGKSTRMNRDKGKIDYHGKEQRLYMNDLLSGLTSESYLSIRPDQSEELSEDVKTIEDVYSGLGPYGAILSAFQKDPNAAWLVTACDQPFLNENTLKYLISKRNPSKLATAFYNSETDFPEPLITIWEPRAYSRMLYFLSLGYSCPRKVLINSDIELVRLENEQVLKNANTPEEFDKISMSLKF
ncbi:NTP transferase domain-containing protein [Reichenbachiella sp. MALMAid0571]|uniref:NTP transferase domain-containing protein n=1 Tax=Reichenbachiella sp. MALMAid0571 TaxID=3143939 RepID=UPI0032DF5719